MTGQSSQTPLLTRVLRPGLFAPFMVRMRYAWWGIPDVTIALLPTRKGWSTLPVKSFASALVLPMARSILIQAGRSVNYIFGPIKQANVMPITTRPLGLVAAY